MPQAKLQNLRERLRAAGLRATGSRIAVLELLLSARSPLSHNDVADRLAEHPWDRATLYRNLLDLVRVGLAERSDAGDHTWRFEAPREGHDRRTHPHFVCTDCGEVQCLPASTISLRAHAQMPSALKEHAVEVQIRGKCDRCREGE